MYVATRVLAAYTHHALDVVNQAIDIILIIKIKKYIIYKLCCAIIIITTYLLWFYYIRSRIYRYKMSFCILFF